MFESLRQIIDASRERYQIRERVQRQLLLPANAQVHVRELHSGGSVQTVITVIEPESIRRYRILKASADITVADLRTPLSD